MSTQELKTNVWRKIKPSESVIEYDETLDTLFVYFSEKETDRIISHFVDDNVAFLYRYTDKEIVGIRIDYFKEEFLVNINEDGWKLSSTGEKLEGMVDLEFGTIEIKKVVTTPLSPTTGQFTIPRLGKRLKVKPVYA